MFVIIFVLALVRCEAAFHNAGHSQDWWPMDSIGRLYARSLKPEAELAKPVSDSSAPKAATMETIKNSVILRASFGKKMKEICMDALAEEVASCRSIASARLFCTLLRRNADKYADVEGVKEEMEKCKNMNIMDTPAEEAKSISLESQN